MVKYREHLEPLAAFLSSLLETLRCSRFEFAKRAGVAKSVIYDLIACQHEPSAANLYRIAAALQDLTQQPCDLDRLYRLILSGRNASGNDLRPAVSEKLIGSDMEENSLTGLMLLISLLRSFMAQRNWDADALANHLNTVQPVISADRLEQILQGELVVPSDILALSFLQLIDADGLTLDVQEIMALVYPVLNPGEHFHPHENGVGNETHP